MKRTKIVCTMGPGCDNPDILKQLMLNGMDVARFNFSHGTHEEQLERLNRVKAVREELGIPVAALLDTKGPEIRTGKLTDGKKVTLVEGHKYILTTREIVGDDTIGHINYNGLNEDVSEGSRILIDDGLIELVVLAVNGTDIECKVINGGELGERKGVNVPGVKIRLPALTDKDKEDIQFGIEQGFDFIAASFVRNADCVREIRGILDAAGSNMKIISKIENEEGIDNIDEIIELSDGIMVARGDMGVEIPAERVPFVQKMLISKCNSACKVVITATQMLDSMMRNPRPTRAEVTDVANAVYDGTDAVMLSGETAAGKYPVEALKMMAQICEETESHLSTDSFKRRDVDQYNQRDVTNAVCVASVSTAYYLKAKCIIAPSFTGFTTRQLSKWRPNVPIVSLSPSWTSVRQMQLYWGVKAVYAPRADSTDEVVENSLAILKDSGFLSEGDLVIITAGFTTANNSRTLASNTNTMRIMTVE